MRIAVPTAVLAGLLLQGALAAAQEPTAPVALNLPAQPLRDALNSLARQTGLQVIYTADNVTAALLAPRLEGQFTTEAALRALLENSGLTFDFLNARTVAITAVDAKQRSRNSSSTFQRIPSSGAEREGDASATGASLRLAQQGDSSQGPAAGRETEGDTKESQRIALEEIVVTGTNIRGAEAAAGSKVHVIDREEIDRAGFSTAQQILQSLPQNFRGDASEHISSTNADGANVASGSGVNLRGLGSSSTLVLLNGHRVLQNGGANADFVDISMLPVTAIERVEVLTDGASAIYGSDAIAGVVNFVLRDSYDGAETRLRYGALTDGAMDEYQLGQVFGKNWGSGNALLSYEFYKRGNLGYVDRKFTRSADLRPFGGSDFSRTTSNPGTIVLPILAAIPAGQDGTALTPGDLLLGQSNSHGANESQDLLPTQETHNVFVTFKQNLTERVRGFGEFRYARRNTANRLGSEQTFLPVAATHPYFVSPVPGVPLIAVNYDYFDALGADMSTAEVNGGTGLLGATVELGATWQAELMGMYGSERVERLVRKPNLARLNEALGFDDPATPFDPTVDGYFNIFADGANTPQNVVDYVRAGFSSFDSRAQLRSFNAKADGELFAIPGGAVKLAVGSEYRQEGYRREGTNFISSAEPEFSEAASFDEQRDIFAAFGEVLLPLVGEDNRLPGMRRLQLSGALRYEKYSDFGDSTNPKLGLLWSPVEGLAVRGTYGTSFKAPRLESLSPALQLFVAQDVPDPTAADGSSLALLLLGNNPSLEAEESTAWTAGLEFNPAALRGFTAELTYFDISFEDRIAPPGSMFTALLQPEFFAPVITRDPDDAVVQAYLDSPLYLDGFAVPPAGEVQVILDGRTANLATTNVNGLDLNLSYAFATGIGSFAATINANYLLHFRESILVTAPSVDRVDTVHYPVDLRLRGSLTWRRNAWSAAVFVNYAASYSDDVSVPARRVDPWTTVDMNLRYDLQDWFGLGQAAFSINGQNLFDDDPPFVNNPEGVGYDPQNAGPLGRFVSFNFTKQW